MPKTPFELLVWNKLLDSKKNKLLLFNSIPMSMYSTTPFVYLIQKTGLDKGNEFIKKMGTLMASTSVRQIKDLFDEKEKQINPELRKIESIVEMTGFGIIEITTSKSEILLKVKKNTIIQYGYEKYQDKELQTLFFKYIYDEFIKGFTEFKKCSLISIEGFKEYNKEKDYLALYRYNK